MWKKPIEVYPSRDFRGIIFPLVVLRVLLLLVLCCIIASRVPFDGLVRGTAILCFPFVRYMWLPFWWTILNPALLRAFRSFRHDRVGGFLDSYFH